MASQLKQRVKEMQISRKKPRDFDPEDDTNFQEDGSDIDSGSNTDDRSNVLDRDHYEKVGKSKLRKTGRVELDQKKYGGQVVSRLALNGDHDSDEDDPLAAVDDDEDEDPFREAFNGRTLGESEDDGSEDVDEISDIEGGDDKTDSDDEIDSDEAFESGDEDTFRKKGFVFRGSGKDVTVAAANGTEEDQEEEHSDSSSHEDQSLDVGDSAEDSGSTEGSDIDMEDLDEDADQDESSEDEDEDEDEISARPRPKSLKTSSNADREKLKSLISTDTAAIAASLSQAASSDAKKGNAVRQQYQTFDRLLDARIKVQKALVSANQLDPQPRSSVQEGDAALQRAEAAALRLYNTIESLRHTISESSISPIPESKKRKRPSPATSSTTNPELWSRLSTLEESSLPNRRSTLDKWSTKTRAGTTTQSASKLNPTHTDAKLSAVIDTYLISESTNLISQSTLTSSTPSFHKVYDDNTFYQSLLRDLIASRSTTATSNPTTPTSTVPLPLKLHASGNTKQKDTKASKGRKIRYTIHEKLENFMTATGRSAGDTGQWTDAAVREFFGSLMGGAGALDEGDENVGRNGAGDDEDGIGRGEEALRLFRST